MERVEINHTKLKNLLDQHALSEAVYVTDELLKEADDRKNENGYEIASFDIDFSEDGGYVLPRLNSVRLVDGTEISFNNATPDVETDEVENAKEDFESLYEDVMNDICDSEYGFTFLVKEIGKNGWLDVSDMVNFHNETAKTLGVAE